MLDELHLNTDGFPKTRLTKKSQLTKGEDAWLKNGQHPKSVLNLLNQRIRMLAEIGSRPMLDIHCPILAI